MTYSWSQIFNYLYLGIVHYIIVGMSVRFNYLVLNKSLLSFNSIKCIKDCMKYCLINVFHK